MGENSALTMEIQFYVAECIGVLEGYIKLCYKFAEALANAWKEHDKQQRLYAIVKEELRTKTTACDLAFSAAKLSNPDCESYTMCLEQIRITNSAKVCADIDRMIADNTLMLHKRTLEICQRVLNDAHRDMGRLTKEIKVLYQNIKYVPLVDVNKLLAECETCLINTSPLKIISEF